MIFENQTFKFIQKIRSYFFKVVEKNWSYLSKVVQNIWSLLFKIVQNNLSYFRKMVASRIFFWIKSAFEVVLLNDYWTFDHHQLLSECVAYRLFLAKVSFVDAFQILDINTKTLLYSGKQYPFVKESGTYFIYPKC